MTTKKRGRTGLGDQELELLLLVLRLVSHHCRVLHVRGNAEEPRVNSCALPTTASTQGHPPHSRLKLESNLLLAEGNKSLLARAGELGVGALLLRLPLAKLPQRLRVIRLQLCSSNVEKHIIR